MNDFNRLTMTSSFHITIAGIVVAVRQVSMAYEGPIYVDRHWREFHLINCSCNYVWCKSLSQRCGDSVIADGNEVVLYDTLASPNSLYAHGFLLLWDESQVFVIARARSIPPAKYLMPLRF